MDPLGKSFLSLSRRQVLSGTAALAAAGVTTPSFGAGGEFVSTVFGGVYEREYRKAFVTPFASANGSDIQLKLGSSSEWLTNAKVNRRNPEIDMLLLPFPDSIRMTMEGLSIPLTADEIPNINDVNPLFYDIYKKTGVAVSGVGYGIAYRHDLVPSPITDWEDLWDPRLAGRVAIPEIGVFGSWEFLVQTAKLAGGSEQNLEPAFKKLKALKPNLKQFVKSGADVVNLLGSGEAWVCPMQTNISPYAVIDAGKPVTFFYPKSGAMAGAASLHIVKNSKSIDLCKKFINFALSKDAQEAFSRGVVALPTNAKAEVDARTAGRIPKPELLHLIDWEKIVPQMSDLAEKWNQSIGF
jgi:putative spermidine/putrescine transport system substrate-binding protein